MKSKNNDVILMLAIVFAIIGGVMLAYGFSAPIVYEKDVTTQAEVQPSPTEIQSSVATSKSVTQANKTTTAKATEAQTQISYPININTATFEELMSIPNIGESRAYAILDYRDELGEYTSVEQIKNIYGFGDKVYSKIAGYLTV